jgi:hypothetical protein
VIVNDAISAPPAAVGKPHFMVVAAPAAGQAAHRPSLVIVNDRK